MPHKRNPVAAIAILGCTRQVPGLPLRAALLGDPGLRGRLNAAGITPARVESALDPVGYLGAAGEFTDAALAAHRAAGG